MGVQRADSLKWTATMLDELRHHAATGKTWRVTAELMTGAFNVKFTKNMIAGMTRRLGLSGDPAAVRSATSRRAATPDAQKASAPPGLPVPKIRADRPRPDVSPRLAPMPAKAIPARVAPLNGIGVFSGALTARHCQWPLWGDREKPALAAMRFCGCAREEGRPYCAGHAARATVKLKPRPEGVVLAFHDRSREALRAKFAGAGAGA